MKSQAKGERHAVRTLGRDSLGERIQSLNTAAKILDGFTSNTAPIRVNELARNLGMTRTRVSRQLLTLLELGFVERVEGVEGYRLGWKLFQLGRIAAQQRGFLEVGVPRLNHLAAETRETAVLVAPANGDAVVCATSITPLGVRTIVQPGTLLLLPKSPSARALVAFAPPDEQRRVMSERFAPSERAYKELNTRLAEIGERFYETGEGMEPHVHAVAAPVFDLNNYVCGGVVLIAFVPDPSRSDWPKPNIVSAVVACAASISMQLGSTRVYKHIGPATRSARPG